MMKKATLFLGVVSALLLGSCSDELQAPVAGVDGNVNFTITLPGATSRAMGDGMSAEQLNYIVYGDNNAVLLSETADFGGKLSTTVSMSLVNGKTYNIAFFAAPKDGAYTLSADSKSVAVDYTKMATSETHADNDAFYVLKTITVNGPIAETITLPRITAQLNWGTSDWDENNSILQAVYGKDIRTRVTTTGYPTFDLLEGDATGSPVTVACATTQKPVGEDFPKGTEYTWLKSSSILVPASAPVIEATLETYAGESTAAVHSVKVTNIPVERNFRTNIFGKLLTSSVDYIVEKDNTWAGTEDKRLWFGETAEPQKNPETGNYEINSAAELAGLAKMVNSGNSFAKETIVLTTDIDLCNIPWTAIGTTGKAFKGLFDGQNHTVSNLSIDVQSGACAPQGLFGLVDSENVANCGIVKNITVEKANIKNFGDSEADGANYGTGAVIGQIYIGTAENCHAKDVNIEGYRWLGGVAGANRYANTRNCSVENAVVIASCEWLGTKYDNGDKVGGIAGFTAENKHDITGNYAKNVTVKGYRDVGGMFGYVYASKVFENNKIEGGKVTQDLTYDYKESNNQVVDHVGAILGSNITYSDTNTASDVEVSLIGCYKWDGTTVTAPAIDEATKTAVIDDAASLAGLAALVNGTLSRGTAEDFEGYTFTIDADIDLGGKPFPMIGAGATRSSSTTSGAAFKGVIDGKNHTIKNLTINVAGSKDDAIGFIPSLKGASAELKNLTFENVNLTTTTAENIGIVGLLSEGATVSNVKVTSGTVSGVQGVGAIVGRILIEGKVSDCHNAANITGTKSNVGGIVGSAYYTADGKTMTVEKCTNTGAIKSGVNATGGIVGLCTGNVSECKNYGTVTGTNGTSHGGIVGEQKAKGKVVKCENYADVSTAAGDFGVGGVIGWIRYATSSSSDYPSQAVIEVTDCYNEGKVLGPNTGNNGGIVGSIYMHAVITNCVNKSPMITGSNMVGGIGVYMASEPNNVVPDAEVLLTVKGCTSTTNKDTQMEGKIKAELVYDNTVGKNTSFENNTYTPAE